jgi:hypothetical protein
MSRSLGHDADLVDDREFVTAVESCAISCGDFRHADHVRLAWIYLRSYSLTEAIDRFTRSLRRFAAHCGVPGKYHETITWAYLLLIHERMQQDNAPRGWDSFRAANTDLFDWKPSILDRYYAPSTLRSDLARRIFVLPDRGVLRSEAAH